MSLPNTGKSGRAINTPMRAWELYEQGNDAPGTPDDRKTHSSRKPVVGLRHINQLKRLAGERDAEYENRQRLWAVMYADADTEQAKLDKREVELDAREQALRLRELLADIDKAIAKAEVSAQHRDQLRKLAMRELNRRKKNLSATSS